MLTLIETISLAGDRSKQNDDALGFSGPRAWVIDGATDLHDMPLTFDASDASWLARYVNGRLFDRHGNNPAQTFRDISSDAAQAFHALLNGRTYEPWQSPMASVLMITERSAGAIHGADLGDCRLFALDADGVAHVAGGPEGGRDAEAAAAATQTDADKPLLQRTATVDRLRRGRAALNQPGAAQWTFGLNPECGDHARLWSLTLKRPAHLLLMTDGFWVLADQYAAYDAAGLVRAALDKGLQELGRETRAVETADAASAKHPRFKQSDDATAMLLRLT